MQVIELKPGIFACLTANETANAGFIVTEAGVIVIDTLNTPARGQELAEAIEMRTDKPVTFVINTHYHYDHVFGNQAFEAPVVAHQTLSEQLTRASARDLMPVAIAARISEHPEDRWLAAKLELIYPQITFERRLEFSLPPVRLIVQHVGGHTPDTTIVDLPDDGILFASDLVFEGRVPFLRQANIADTIEALRYLEGLGARTIVPGYGKLCDVAYVAQCREYIEALQSKVGELVDQGLERGDILDSEQLPQWWTDDHPELVRANVERVLDELTGL